MCAGTNPSALQSLAYLPVCTEPCRSRAPWRKPRTEHVNTRTGGVQPTDHALTRPLRRVPIFKAGCLPVRVPVPVPVRARPMLKIC